MKISFTVPGLPRPKERPRKGKHGNMYTPSKTRKYEEEIWWMAHQSGARQDCFKNVQVGVTIVARMGYQMKDLLRCDIDNIAKAILDGLKPAFNDAYVMALNVTKRLSDQEPCVIVSVEGFL